VRSDEGRASTMGRDIHELDTFVILAARGVFALQHKQTLDRAGNGPIPTMRDAVKTSGRGAAAKRAMLNTRQGEASNAHSRATGSYSHSGMRRLDDQGKIHQRDH